MIEGAAEGVRVLVGGVFVLAAASKLLLFRGEAARLWLPWSASSRQRELILGSLIVVELIMGLLVSFAVLGHYSLIVSLCALLAIFTLYGRQAIREGGSCSCFGAVSRNMPRREGLYVRNGTLAILGSLALAGSHSSRGVLTPAGGAFAMLIPWMTLGAVWTIASVLRSFAPGRALLRQARILIKGRQVIT